MKAEILPSGAYRYRVFYYTSDGKRHAKSFTDVDRNVAKRAALEFENGARRSAPAAGSFGMALDGYILARETLLSPSTIKGYRAMQNRLKNDFRAFYGYAVADITGRDVQNILNTMAKEGATQKTIRNYTGLISGVMREKGILLTGIVLPKKKARNITIPEEKTVREALSLAKGTSLEVPIMLAAFAGLRRGEVCAIKESDLDFENNVLHVCRDLVQGPDRRWHEKPPKTKASDRYIELPKESMELLHNLPDMNPQMLSNRFHRFLVKNGLPVFRFHDLRHFCASYMHSQGIPDAYIMQRCGWENDDVLKAIYRHTLEDQNKTFVKAVNDSFRSFL